MDGGMDIPSTIPRPFNYTKPTNDRASMSPDLTVQTGWKECCHQVTGY